MENSANNKVLVVDDDREVRYSLKRVLSGDGYEFFEASSGEEGIEMAEEHQPAVILLDNRMEGISGMEALQNLRSLAGNASIVMMTAYGTTQTAIEAMKFGAFDYLIKPFEPERIREVVRKAIRAVAARQSSGNYQSRLRTEDYAEGIVGSSEAMQLVLKQVGQVTASEATVMITGESGTGKELIASCICKHSLRSKKAFIAVNCAAIPENLIESELFGHEKGSFTGATTQRKGKFELCDGGTIFLDEIGDMALPTQTKILRAIQAGEIQRVGGTETIKVDVRMIAATNKDLEEMVAKKEFREDLYYRLNVFRIRIPPLRERPTDIPEIIDYHLQRLAKDKKIRPKSISREALECLVAQRWSGNVRELENVIYRSAVVAQGDTILLADLPGDIAESGTPRQPIQRSDLESPEVPADSAGGSESIAEAITAPTGSNAVAERDDLNVDELFDRLFQRLVESNGGSLLQNAEQQLIQRALSHVGGNQGKAATLLGVSRGTLRNRMGSIQKEEG